MTPDGVINLSSHGAGTRPSTNRVLRANIGMFFLNSLLVIKHSDLDLFNRMTALKVSDHISL